MEESETYSASNLKDNNIEEAVETFRSIIENFDEKIRPLKSYEKIDRFGTVSVHSFFEQFLVEYCRNLIKSNDLEGVKQLFDHIEYLLQTFPLLENPIAVSFLEDLYGNYYDDRAIYIRYSGPVTLELAKQIMRRFIR